MLCHLYGVLAKNRISDSISGRHRILSTAPNFLPLKSLGWTYEKQKAFHIANTNKIRKIFKNRSGDPINAGTCLPRRRWTKYSPTPVNDAFAKIDGLTFKRLLGLENIWRHHFEWFRYWGQKQRLELILEEIIFLYIYSYHFVYGNTPGDMHGRLSEFFTIGFKSANLNSQPERIRLIRWHVSSGLVHKNQHCRPLNYTD